MAIETGSSGMSENGDGYFDFTGSHGEVAEGMDVGEAKADLGLEYDKGLKCRLERLGRRQAIGWDLTRWAEREAESCGGEPHEALGVSRAVFAEMRKGRPFPYWGLPGDDEVPGLLRKYDRLASPPEKEPGLAEAIVEKGAKVLGSGLLLSAGGPPGLTEVFVDKLYDAMPGGEKKRPGKAADR